MLTQIGIAQSVVTVAVWMATLQPHGGVDLSFILFPFARLMAGIYTDWSVPVLAW